MKLRLAVVLVLAAGCWQTSAQQAPTAPARPQPLAQEPFPVAGTWISQVDGSLLELTQRTIHLRFPFEDGTRDNFGEILSYDVAAGHILLRYTRVLQNGEPVEPKSGNLYMTYRIDGETLYKWIDTDGWAGPDKLNLEAFMRSR